MAETQNRLPRDRRQPSRLQRRAPASIQVTRPSDWNVAIPLLSPLVSPTTNDLTAEIRSCGQVPRKPAPEPDKPKQPAVFKKWQHPAAPFCYEPPAAAMGFERSLINS